MKEYLIKIVKSNVKLYKMAVKAHELIVTYKKNSVFFRMLYNVFYLKQIKVFENSSVFNYVIENKVKLKYLEEEQYRPVYIPVNVPVRSESCVLNCLTPSVYYTILDNVIIIGASNWLIKDGKCLNDKLLLPYSDGFEFCSGPIHEYFEKESYVEIDMFPKKISEGISLIGEAANNYYHWVFDLLNKIAYINQFEDLKDVPLLIDETVPRHATCIRLLKLIDTFQHPIIYLKENRSYTIDKLHYFSPCTWSNVYEKNNRTNDASHAKSSYALGYFRKNTEKITRNIKSNVGKKIFITRPADKFKRLVNENELADIAVKYGFELYDPAQFSIEQQMADFSNAEYIIAASGAALVNLIWCKPGTKLLCISLAEWKDYNYSTLAYLLGIKCTYFDGDIIKGITHKVDKTLFENYIKGM